MAASQKAEVAQNSVGLGDAFTAAANAGCMSRLKGESGLVIDNTGFLQDYVRVRLPFNEDVTEGAYWVDGSAIGSTVPLWWDFRRYLWWPYGTQWSDQNHGFFEGLTD